MSASELRKSKGRIDRQETVNLVNDYYNVPLGYDGLESITGLVVLVCEEELSVKPTDAVPDIYQEDFPIHVFSWSDAQEMTSEIDTVPDLMYYLGDRFQYLVKGNDIALDRERSALGHYKMAENRFPSGSVDFSAYDYWEEYRGSREDDIARRDEHNGISTVFDLIASQIPNTARRYDGLPTGLYFAWEMAALSRRQRACYADKLLSVPAAFQDGRTHRQFALHNEATGNWTVFYFAQEEQETLAKRLMRLVELKLVKEVHCRGFEYGVFGLGYQVSQGEDARFLGLSLATFSSPSEVKGYTRSDLEEATKIWGTASETKRRPIEEFPSAE